MIVVDGVAELGGADHTVMPDRIVAATYTVASAITNGNVTLDDYPFDSLLALVDRMQHIGVHIDRVNPAADPRRCSVTVTSQRVLKPVMITTQPYPGFPTDLQAQMMALLCIAQGNSIITEKIYPERFMHVAELTRMGAQLFRQGPTVMVQGVGRLVAAPVMASDLRGSACLVLAGLAAEGTTTVSRVYHLDRGYARLEQTLNGLVCQSLWQAELAHGQRIDVPLRPSCLDKASKIRKVFGLFPGQTGAKSPLPGMPELKSPYVEWNPALIAGHWQFHQFHQSGFVS